MIGLEDRNQRAEVGYQRSEDRRLREEEGRCMMDDALGGFHHLREATDTVTSCSRFRWFHESNKN
jgi:hypothetical protein